LNSFSQEELLSGLYFSSHEVIQDKRTSLNLTPNKSFEFDNGFSLEFDANFRRGDGYYGYIFRIIGDNNTNIDLVSNLASHSSNFRLVYKDQILISYNWRDLSGAGYDQWMKVRVDIDVKNSKIQVTLNGVKQDKIIPEIATLKKFELVFGACKNSAFLSTDVCPMSLKNIQIYDHNNQLFRNWKLSKHDQNKVYDETSEVEAHVDNPIWIIDKHIKWQKLKDFQVNDLFGIAKDEDNERLFFINAKAVYVVSAITLEIDTIPFSGGSPYHDFLGKQIIYNKYTDELWSYNFDSDKISRFNFQTRKWSFDQSLARETDFAHQNKFISPLDSSLITFLGYGHYTYKGSVNHYNNKSQRWDRIDRSNQIDPRYLSGAGFMDNQKILVFGGYGSKSGRQDLSPGFYYDLYSFNLQDYSFTKLWTLDPPSIPFVPSESLIYDDQSKSFYTLVFNRGNFKTDLRLAQFGVEKPDFKLYNDSIPFDFLDVESGATLFLNEKKSELIALTYHNADISMYSIAYPPLMSDDVYQNKMVRNQLFSRWGILLLLLCLSGVGAYAAFRKRRIRKELQLNQKIDHHGIETIPPIERKAVSSILFMGGFQIFDSKGRNLTSAFSPTLKQLFLFIFLHTIKNEKGVSSAKLDEVLWYDKSGESARNNRNVNISKLRTILDEVEGVEVINENSYWKIRMDAATYCDYCEILNLLRKSKSINLGESEIKQLIGLLSFGEFLPAIQTEWMDGFKSRFANEIIDEISSLLNGNLVKANFSLRYHLAECILVSDPLNDEAFAIKCSVLYHLGKKGMAKNIYDSFCREYKQVLGIDYAVPFNDTIK
jgi:two-component SAPR family response regulator